MPTRDEILALSGERLAAAVLIEYLGYCWLKQELAVRDMGCDFLTRYTLVIRGEWQYKYHAGKYGIHEVADADWSDTVAKIKIDNAALSPHTDRNALSLVEAEIGRRGLGSDYTIHLIEMVSTPTGIDEFSEPYRAAWLVRTAPPDICCRAALLCAMEADNAK